MTRPTSIPRILTSPQILLLADGRRSLCFDATPATAPPKLTVKPDGETRTVVGYRQTKEPAARGGKANKNFFRFRTEGMRAFARSFRGQPFITAHDRGDVRMRGGTIVDSWIDETDAEMLIVYELTLTEAWAKAGFASGAIDRFSMGAWPTGPAFCTVHNAPMWSTDDCYDAFCWPGFETDGMLVELEYQDAEGLELSGVNVPAVDDTYVVDPSVAEQARAAIAALNAGVSPILATVDANIAAMRAMSELTGQMPPGLARLAGGARVGDFSGRPPRPSIASNGEAHREVSMNREQLCKSLGLPLTATDAEIQAKIGELTASSAQAEVLRTQLADSGRSAAEASARAAELAAERDAAHVESEIARLRTTRQVTDQVVDTLRTAAAGTNGRATFDSSLRLVEAAAPAKTPAPMGVGGAAGGRPALQSDARPLEQPENVAPEPDAFELNRTNTNLSTFAKWGKVTTAQIREHGSRVFNVVPELGKLAEDTAVRETAETARRARKELL